MVPTVQSTEMRSGEGSEGGARGHLAPPHSMPETSGITEFSFGYWFLM